MICKNLTLLSCIGKILSAVKIIDKSCNVKKVYTNKYFIKKQILHTVFRFVLVAKILLVQSP